MDVILTVKQDYSYHMSSMDLLAVSGSKVAFASLVFLNLQNTEKPKEDSELITYKSTTW